MSTLDISGAINFRDTGGLPAGVSRTRAGVLYRSGNLARLDEDDLKDLMIDLDLEKGSKEAEAFEQAVKDLDE